MENNKKEKLLLDQTINNVLNKNLLLSSFNDQNFFEIASSLAYCLQSFSNLNKFLDYISLISKHIISEDLTIIIPLNRRGNISIENIRFIGNLHDLNLEKEVKKILNKFNFAKQFRIKDIVILEDFFTKYFKGYSFTHNKVMSRNKCRGFFYSFHNNNSETSTPIEQNISFLLSFLAVGIENYDLAAANKIHEKVDREIASGAEIQSQLLPDFCPVISGVQLAAHCRPALQLGGDYYDFMSIRPNVREEIRQKGRWALVIGDVMGKGIPAGLLMTMLRGMLRAEVLTGLPPDRILHDLNQLAISDLDLSHRFITLFYSDYDPRTKKLRFANAAHNPPLLWKNSEQRIIKLDADGIIIGLQKDADYNCGEVKLQKSDVILYYTDGITESSNSDGERFEEKRLINAFSRLCKKSLNSQDILNQIFKNLDDFMGKNKPLQDDSSIVVFKVE